MTIAAPRLDGRGWALLLALAFLWSLSFVLIKVAAAEIPIFTLVLARVGLAALVLHAVALATRMRYPSNPGLLARYGAMGLVNNVLPFALIVYATSRLGAGPASILNATSPIFAILVAHVVTVDEKITPAKLVGVLLGFVGVAAMSGPEAVAGLAGDLPAVAAMLLASFFYGVAAILGRSFRGIEPAMSATCQLTASTLMLLPIALVVDRPWSLPPAGTTAVLAAVALAVFSTALAYILYYALIRRAGGTNAILVTLIIPVGGVALAWALLGEALSLAEAAGMLLIGLGLLVIDGRATARLLSPSAAFRPGP